MLLSRKQTIQDTLVELLAQNPYITGPRLISMVNTIHGTVAKQSVYTALTYLLSEEIVTKAGSQYLLTKFWVNKIYRLLDIQSKNQIEHEAIFDLKDGESISYHFPSLLSCDTYWEHVFNVLLEYIPENKPIVVWNPHEWFRIARYNIERAIFDSFTRNNKCAFFITRGNTKLDKEFKKTWKSNHCSINTDDALTIPNSCYINVFDDFTIEVFLSTIMTEKIENYFAKTQTVTENNKLLLESIIAEKYPVRMKISRNSKKSQILSKRLLRDFYIPPHIITSWKCIHKP